MNRLTHYFALTDRQPQSYQGDLLHLGKANCPVPTQVEPIIFTELGGGCDDEHLHRVEERKGDMPVVDPGIWYVLAACCVFWAVVIQWLF